MKTKWFALGLSVGVISCAIILLVVFQAFSAHKSPVDQLRSMGVTADSIENPKAFVQLDTQTMSWVPANDLYEVLAIERSISFQGVNITIPKYKFDIVVPESQPTPIGNCEFENTTKVWMCSDVSNFTGLLQISR